MPSTEVTKFFWTIELDSKVGLDVNGILIGKSTNYVDGNTGMSAARLKVEFGKEYPVLVPPVSIVDRDNAVSISLKRDQTNNSGLEKTKAKLADELIWNWLGFCMACAPSGNTFDQEIVLDPSSPFFQKYPYAKGTSSFINQNNTINDIDVMQFNWVLANGANHLFTPGIVSNVPFKKIVYAGFAFSNDYRISTLPACRFKAQDIADTAFAFDRGSRLGRDWEEGVNLLPTLGRLAMSGMQQNLPQLGNVSGVRILVGTTRQKFETMLHSHGIVDFRFEGQTKDGSLNIFGFGEKRELSNFEQLWASQFASVEPRLLEIICPYIAIVALSKREITDSKDKLSQKWNEEFGSDGIPYLLDERSKWVNRIIGQQPKLERHYLAWEDYKNEWRNTHVKPIG